jgi:hypothetical protein
VERASRKETSNAVKSTKKAERRPRSRSSSTAREKSPGWLNLRSLNLGCLRCGEDGYWKIDYSKKHDELKCEACGKIGHSSKVCLEKLRVDKMKAEQAHSVSPMTGQPESDDKEVPAGGGDMDRTSPRPSAKNRGRLTHFSHRVEAQKDPKVKTTGRENLWYSWVVEQGKLNSSGKVKAPRRETADRSSQTTAIVEKMDTTVKTAGPLIPSQAGLIPPPLPSPSLSRVTAVLSTRDLGSKKLTLPILLDCGCSTNLLSVDAARKIGARIDEAKNVMLYNASGENIRISGQSIIKVDIPSLSKTAFLNFLVTPDLPRIEQVMV